MTQTNLTRLTNICSHVLGVQTLTLGVDGKAQGADFECRNVHVKAETSKTVYMGTDTTVDANDPQLPSTYYLRFNVDNTQALWFYGTAGDKVYIIAGN